MLGICFLLTARNLLFHLVQNTLESRSGKGKGGCLSPPTNPASLAFVISASFALRSQEHGESWSLWSEKAYIL